MTYSNISNKAIRLEILNKYDSHCAYCGCPLTIKSLNIDHVEPLRRKMPNCVQGSHHKTNFNPSCAPCNQSKSSMDLEHWREEISKKLDRLYRDSATYRLAKRFGLLTENRAPVKFYFETYSCNG